MDVQLIGTTNNIKNQKDAKRFIQNHARVCYTNKNWDKLLDEDFQSGLVRSLINKGHHSPFDHFVLNLNFSGIEKAVAMVFNNQGVYTTSEKSARYTVMKDVSEHQKSLYGKWNDWFNEEISSRFPKAKFSKLYEGGSDGKTSAEKLSQ
jgi:thymidylate synthase ThyX